MNLFLANRSISLFVTGMNTACFSIILILLSYITPSFTLNIGLSAGEKSCFYHTLKKDHLFRGSYALVIPEATITCSIRDGQGNGDTCKLAIRSIILIYIHYIILGSTLFERSGEVSYVPFVYLPHMPIQT